MGSISRTSKHDLVIYAQNLAHAKDFIFILIRIFNVEKINLKSNGSNLQIMLSSAVLHILNWVFHCSTLTPELHSTMA